MPPLLTRVPAPFALAAALALLPARARATEYFVAPGGTGSGTAAAPFGRIQQAIMVAMPGDTVTVRPGMYNEQLQTARAGTAAAPITVRGEAGGARPVVTNASGVLRVNHAHLVVDGLVLDGAYGAADLVLVEDGGDGFVLRNAEVRRTSRDCIDIRDTPTVLIERSAIHHCLNAAGGRTDAHGVAAGAVRELAIRDSEIHTFSGDAVQLDPARSPRGWGRLVIERCRLWLAPLPAAENGFAAGTVTGENAVDTKIAAGAPRGVVIVRDTEAYGFGPGLISNMAAFNLKENIDATLDRVTVRDSEIALRLRAPAQVAVRNAVIFNVRTAVRYEDGIVAPRLYNSTLGAGVMTAFQQASSSSTRVDARNVLVLGSALPSEAPAASGNLAVMASAFVNATAGDYHLAAGSPAIDTGMALAEVTTDRDGVRRPQGSAYDRGAYERCVGPCMAVEPTPDGGPAGSDASAPVDSGATGGDAASGRDASPTDDAGCCDAGGARDGGGGTTPPGRDGATTGDGGGTTQMPAGCACRAAGALPTRGDRARAGLLALLAVGLVAARARRRDRAARA